MANGWVKSLQCKSRAVDDVVHRHRKSLKHPLLQTSSSCRNSVQNIKDVIEATKHKPRKKPRQPLSSPSPPPPPRTSSSRKAEPPPDPANRLRPSTSTRHSRAPDPFLPALTELPQGHPSRNVVEIIFHTSWSPKAFSSRIEVVFKVQNLPRTVNRFEEYREMVKSRAASEGGAAPDDGCEDHARCIADGNEVMRFHCLGPTAGGPGYDGGGSGAWAFGGKGAICTFSGSGVAHESAGGGRGRRAMLVCRVIAGRVCKQPGCDTLLESRVGFNSVSGENGELLVYDSRAVLPCFLIIYKL